MITPYNYKYMGPLQSFVTYKILNQLVDEGHYFCYN